MCASCGCGSLDDNHGDDRNITMTALRDAGEAAGISAQEAAKNIQQAVGQATGDGQSQAATQGQTNR